MKTPRHRRLICAILLALGSQTYTVSSFAVDVPPVAPTASAPAPKSVPASTTPAPATKSVPVSTVPAVAPPVTPAPPTYTTDIIAQMIKGMIANAAWQKEATEEIYRLSEHKLIWLNNKHTEAALKFLNEAPANKGLHSEYYNSQWLNANWQQLKATPEPTFEQLALFDTNLSSSLLSYFSDVRYGRVNPKKVSFDFEINKEHLKLAQETFNTIKDGSFTKQADNLESKLVFYRRMRHALNQYQQAAREHKVIHFKFSGLKEHQSDPQIVELRQLLTTLGDVSASKDNSKSETYDADLVAGVKRFQRRHGLGASGVLNKETASALNVPLADRIAQIELSLERLRWVPEPTADRFVIVNIPSFQLWAFDSLKDEKSKPMIMRVVVGEADDKQTPSLSSTMNQIEFRPTWTVPQSIIKNEMMAKLENNPGYFAKRNMKVVYHDNGRISIRQASGDHNALGLVKFLFPNNHSVYFHDTPMQKYFSASRRDFSHGCVRLAQPQLLAQYALKNQPGNWTEEKIKKAMHQGGSKRIALQHPIPIVIFYGTAIDLDNNGVTFFHDVYGHDKRLRQALLHNKTKATSKKT